LNHSKWVLPISSGLEVAHRRVVVLRNAVPVQQAKAEASMPCGVALLSGHRQISPTLID
jgi:hypothetical protein